MLDGLNGSVGVASVATAALRVALVQQSQFEQVLEDTVDRKRKEAEALRQSTSLPKNEVEVKAVSAKDTPPAPPVASVPVDTADPQRGETVNIEI